MKYTINGKEYSEFDIKKRCAELMCIQTATTINTPMKVYRKAIHIVSSMEYNPCNNPQDTWPIIEKCWGELNEFVSGKQRMETRWIFTMQKHNCSKLVAACICLIELNES